MIELTERPQSRGGVSFSMQSGCIVTQYTMSNEAYMTLYTGTEQDGAAVLQRAQQAAAYVSQFAQDKRYQIKKTEITHGGAAVTLQFKPGFGVAKHQNSLKADVLPALAPLCRNDNCRYCGTPLNGSNRLVLHQLLVAPAHEQCLAQITNQHDNWQPPEERKVSMAGGILGAVGGMLVGVLLWALVGMAGYISALAALAMAWFIGKGYDMMHGKQGRERQITMIALVAVGVVLGTLAVILVQLLQLRAEYWPSMPLDRFIHNVSRTRELMDAIQDDFIRNLGMGIFFSALGCFGILRNAAVDPERPERPVDLG